MLRTIAYWGATGLVTSMALLGAFTYLTSSPQAVENFQHVGYPQQLRVLLASRSWPERSRCFCHDCRR
jgi:hypothetical protein